MASRKKPAPSPIAAPADPLWYKDGVIYQTHVRAFFDSDNDGIGDFPGLTRKLDYLQDLGVTAIWLLPFYPSPLRDDGYDIAEYTAINPSYGTLADFRNFLRQAHERGLRVITELVINHTSDQHPWFQKSRRAKPGSPWRDFYVWSDTPDKYTDARIIFKDFETSNWAWDPVAKAYYWHRFFSHQPDLNFDNPAVHDALFKALDFWMDMGVDAFRLDAVPYLFEREGTTCENLPETHQFLKKVRRHIDEKYPNRMLLAEANQWPEDSLPYFGDGDECQMAFNFPVMPRMYMALAQEDRFPIVDIMAQTPPIPENCQWAVFLRNHDELTLEMVTDEDRDYMYRTYAKDAKARINLGIRRRLAPLLGNHRGRIQLMNGLLFSFPGTPIIYYGDEIGMGDNIYLGDRNGVRTPMQWSADRNAGFSRANPQSLYLPTIIDPQYHYEALNVESEQNSPHSLLWWTKRLIAMRKRYQAFGRGTLEFLQPDNRKVLAFVRRYGEEVILVVANLSRLVQFVELDLSQYRGMQLVELSSRTEFPAIADRPYFLNLGPYAFYWFSLERKREANVEIDSRSREELPVIRATEWKEIFSERNRDALEQALLPYIGTRRWFGGKSRKVASLRVREAAEIPAAKAVIALLDVEYVDGDPETYQLPLAILSGRRSGDATELSAARIARLGREGDAVLYEPVNDPAFAEALLDLMAKKRTLHGPAGAVRGSASIRFRELRGDAARLEAQTLRGEQSNTAIIFGGRLFLKLFRRLEPGINTDLEVSRFLSEETSFAQTPPLAGWLDYEPQSGESMTLGILQGYAEGTSDAWRFTLDSIGQFFERLLSEPAASATIDSTPANASPLDLSDRPVPAAVAELLGTYAADAELLGKRTAQMHQALAMSTSDRAFAPEPFTPHYQRSIYQHIRTQIVQTVQMLRRRVETLPEAGRADARQFIEREEALQARLRGVLAAKITAQRIRTHGDYHLGQVLRTANDFLIIDFEGEPSRPLSERRIKRPALRDVAGMLRSFDYAPYAVLFGQVEGTLIRPEDLPKLEAGARFWVRWASAAFLRGYLLESAGASYLPAGRAELTTLLDAYVIEKAVYEIRYELDNRPEWVIIPLRGILEILK